MRTERHGSTDRDAHRQALVAVARYEGRSRVTVTVILTILFSLFGGLYLWMGPDLVAGEQVQQMLEAMPAVLNELMGFESLASLEGLLASEYYTLGWSVGLGAYVAYTAAGSVAGDIRDDTMDMLLAGPVARRSVLLGKFLALLVPITVLNLIVPIALYAGSVAVGSPLAVVELAAVHLLSVPYFLFWGAAGLLLGVIVRRGRTAGRVALGIVFIAWLFESVIATTDFPWLGAVSPTWYFDPPAILVESSFDLFGAGLLLVAAVALVGVSDLWFRTHDI